MPRAEKKKLVVSAATGDDINDSGLTQRGGGDTEQPAVSDDSGLVDDVRSGDSKLEQSSLQPSLDVNSADFVPTWVQASKPSAPNTPKTSSNIIHYPCDESSNELVDPAIDKVEQIKPESSVTCDQKQPPVLCGEVKFEVSGTETDISGDRVTLSDRNHSGSGGDNGSLSAANNPESDKVTTDNSVELKTCSNPSCSFQNEDFATYYQPYSESKESFGDVSTAPILKNPLMSRKDRVRIQLQLPRDVIGRFIGKQGRNIKALMLESDGAHVYINQKNLPKDAEIVPCTIQGTAKQVDEAVSIVESKFPEIIVPETLVSRIPMDQFPQPMPCHLLVSSSTPNKDSAGSWNYILTPASIPPSPFSGLVCFIESLNHVWMFTRENTMYLDQQHRSMSCLYYYTAKGGDQLAKEGDPNLIGKFCAVRVSDIHWLRGRVTKFGDNLSTYVVQLVDYGSNVVVPPSCIKPLRYVCCSYRAVFLSVILLYCVVLGRNIASCQFKPSEQS